MYFAIAGISDKPAAEVEYESYASEKRGGEAAGRRLDYVAGSVVGSCLRFPGLDAKNVSVLRFGGAELTRQSLPSVTVRV